MVEISKRYRHFKGGEYEVVALAGGGMGLHMRGSSNYRVVGYARDCEDSEARVCFYEKDGEIFLEKRKGKFVIYKQLYESDFPKGEVWFRSLDDFCEEKVFDDGRRVRRFELVGCK